MAEKIQVTENMRTILRILQASTEPMTAEDVAKEAGLTAKSVNASFNRIANEALGLGYRDVKTLDLGDCKTKDVKVLKLTSKGKNLNLNEDITIKVK